MYCPRLLGVHISFSSGRCEVSIWDSDDAVPQAELLKNVSGIHGLYCLLSDRIDQAVIQTAGPQLKVISTMSVGYDHVDLDECRKRWAVFLYVTSFSQNKLMLFTTCFGGQNFDIFASETYYHTA